jgi:SCY1-like protein 1
MALAATSDLFSEDDCAGKLLPAICPSLVDKEKLVRDQAGKTMDIYMQRIRKYQATLPDTILPPPNSTASNSNAAANTPRMGTPAADSSSWTGWAISSFTNKLASASGQMQPATNGSLAAPARPGDQRSASVPPRPSMETRPAMNRTLTPSAAPAAAAAAGMSFSTRTSTSENPFGSERADEDNDDDFGAAWGDDDDNDDDDFIR